MGFTTIAAAAAVALPKVLEANAYRQQSKNLNAAANEQRKLANRQADALTDVAMENQRRASRNAQAQMGGARVDAAASNLAGDGTAHVREVDMATRLQDEITNNANAALDQANSVRQQGAYNAWNTRNSARQAKLNAYGSGISAIGSLFGGLASGLNQSAQGGSGSPGKKR